MMQACYAAFYVNRQHGVEAETGGGVQTFIKGQGEHSRFEIPCALTLLGCLFPCGLGTMLLMDERRFIGAADAAGHQSVEQNHHVPGMNMRVVFEHVADALDDEGPPE